jgi:hypothetical protein
VSDPEPIYALAEMMAVDSLLVALRQVNCALFTAASLPDDLAASWPEHAGKVPGLTAALAKLRREPRAKLAAWLAGLAYWVDVEDGERFVLFHPPEAARPGASGVP